MDNGKSREEGFSLLELLIAMSILAFGLLGTATMLSMGMGSDRFAHRVTVESSLASSVAEELLGRAPSDSIFSSSVSGAVYDLDTGSIATTRTVQGRTYSATYSITPSSPVLGTSRVEVTVSSGARSTTLSFLKGTL